MLRDENKPVQSKLDVIANWPIPTSVQAMFSFIRLVHFNHINANYMKLRLKPLHLLAKSGL